MATVVEIPKIQGETQKGRFLCWAAAAMTAMRTLRANQPGAATDGFPEQWDLSVFNVADGSFDAFGRSFDVTALRSSHLPRAQGTLDMLRNGACRIDANGFGVCDRPGFPILLDHDFEQTPEGKALSFCDLTLLMQARRPVVFEWRFLEPGVSPFGDPLGPGGDHYMVVVGTRDDRDVPEVLIWDPWPQEFGAPNLDDHLKWIPYTEYVHPISDQGSGRPRHGVDRYDIRPPGAPKTPGLGRPCPVATEAPTISLRRQPVPTLQRSRNVAAKYGADNRETAGAVPARTPLPVFAIAPCDIAEAGGCAARLVASGGFASVEPVEDASGKLVDAYLVLNDGEHSVRAGYINKAIARRLFDARARHSADTSQLQPREEDGYFILAIPSRREFFLGFKHPEDSSLQLVPVDDEPPAAKPAVAKAASEVFPQIAAQIAARKGLNTAAGAP